MDGLLALFLIDIGLTILNYVLQPKSGTSTLPSTPNVPQANEGGPVPVVFGTCKVSPNTLWVGDGNPIPVTRGAGAFRDPVNVGYIYSLGLQAGICMGPIDELTDIIFGSKSLLAEDESVRADGVYGLALGVSIITTPAYVSAEGTFPFALTGSGTGVTIIVVAPGILGSKDPGGGVKGSIDVYFGKDTQTVSDYLAAKIGTSIEIGDGMVSPYPGMCYAVFRGSDDTAHSFEWGLSPQLSNLAFVVRRCPSNLSLSGYANIAGDANPAEVIYECLTNADWGLKLAAGLLDIASFQAAAETLFTESLGYSASITAIGSADTVIGDVLRHIDGALRRDPTTGLIGLALTRDDYTIEDLPVVDPSNARDCQWNPSSWSRTTNRVNITYTERGFDFNQKVVTAENLANIQSTGEVRSETIDFLGLSNATAAQFVAARSLKVLSGGIGAARITTNRQLSTIRKSGVFVLNWPAYGIANVVMRVTDITTGTLEDGTVQIDAVEDIFAIGDAIYTAPTALGDSVPVSLSVSPPSNLAILAISGTTALARWLYAAGAEYTEVFLVAGAVGSVALGDRVAVLGGTAPQFLLRGLANTTEYTVGVRHRDKNGVASDPIYDTFTTNTAARSITRPAAIDIMRVSDAGFGDSAGAFGVVVGLYASDPSLDLVIERAPDNGSGAPNTGSITTVATLLGSSQTYSDVLTNDGATYWYRTRHAIASTLSDPTIWVSAIPAHLPDTPVRPMPIDAQVDDSTTTETASSGTLALGITDPQGRILTCEMRTRAGNGAWGGWTSETSATVDLVEKQPSGIAYRVAAYDATNILRTYMFGSVVPFSAGSQPVVQIATLTSDNDFRVKGSLTGDSDTRSIRAYASTSGAPTAADVIASGTTIDGRNAVFDFSTFAPNITVYVGALGYNATGATGLQSQLVSGSVYTTPDPSNVPAVSIQSNQIDRSGTLVTLTMRGVHLPPTYNWKLYLVYAAPSGNYSVISGNGDPGNDSPVIASGSDSSNPLPATTDVDPPTDVAAYYALVLTDTSDNWLADTVTPVQPTLPGITTGGVAAWDSIPAKPTTVAGYAITDVYTKTAADAKYLPLAGGTLTGDIVFGEDVTERFIRNGYYGGAIRFRSNSAAGTDRGLWLGTVDNSDVWTEYAAIAAGSVAIAVPVSMASTLAVTGDITAADFVLA